MEQWSTNFSEIFVPSRAEFLERIQDFVAMVPHFASLSAKSRYHISLCVEEAFANIVHYAYPKDEGLVHISARFNDEFNRIEVRFADTGIPFNPLDEDPPDILAPSEERNIGGLGIFIVRQFMDLVEYKNIDGKNILIMGKTLSPDTVVNQETPLVASTQTGEHNGGELNGGEYKGNETQSPAEPVEISESGSTDAA